MNKLKSIILVITGLMIVITLALMWKPSGEKTVDNSENQTTRSVVTVHAVEAKKGSIQAWIFTEGTARSAQREYLTFNNAGRVAYVKPGENNEELREGEVVKNGELLAYQDQRKYKATLQTAKASLQEAKTRVDVAETELALAKTEEVLAQTTFQRYESLLAKKSASDQEYDEAKASAAKAKASVARAESQLIAGKAQVDAAEAKVDQTQVELEETELRSPIDGIIAYLNIEKGYYFTPSLVRTDSETSALQTMPMVIIDPGSYEITVNVPSYERGRVQIGQSALVAVNDDWMETALSKNDNTSLENPSLDELFTVHPVRGSVYSVNPAISPGGRAI